jgi:hypothetical protein
VTVGSAQDRPAWPRVLRAVGLAATGLALIAGGRLAYPYIYLWGAARGYWDKAEPEVHLIPAGFQGPVLIIYNDSSGSPRRYEGKARRYDIPPTGILRSQFGPNDGWGRPDYEYVDSTGRRTAIVPGTPCDDTLPGDPVQACLMGLLGFSDRPTPPYAAYVVGRHANRREFYERGDSLVRVVLYGERP